MPNNRKSGIFDYIEWRGDLHFASDPFNAVDNIIFSILSYYPLDSIVPPDFEQEPVPFTVAIQALITQEKTKPEILRRYIYKTEQMKLLKALLTMPRYAAVKLAAYINKIDHTKEMQFSALTFVSADCPSYIAYRGTDLTLIGWKEDFNMIFTEVIPSQREAAAYLNSAAGFLEASFNVGGHSKGGNLAVYAASFCDASIQNRILTIYNNDAPGVNKKTSATKEYRAIEKKIKTYIPQDSIIGLLFEYQKDYTVVRSTENGFMQHDPFSWQVRRNDLFHVEQSTTQSKFVSKTLMLWLDTLDYQTRQQFIDSLYTILTATEVKSIPEFVDKWPIHSITMLKSMASLDKATRDMLLKTFSGLFDIVRSRFSLLIKENKKDPSSIKQKKHNRTDFE
ncbi:Mbeg1-like protein [Breznakiellaceae bacterium SP9]